MSKIKFKSKKNYLNKYYVFYIKNKKSLNFLAEINRVLSLKGYKNFNSLYSGEYIIIDTEDFIYYYVSENNFEKYYKHTIGIKNGIGIPINFMQFYFILNNKKNLNLIKRKNLISTDVVIYDNYKYFILNMYNKTYKYHEYITENDILIKDNELQIFFSERLDFINNTEKAKYDEIIRWIEVSA